MIPSVNFYDTKGRLIQKRERNISGGADMTTTQYDFAGRPIRILHRQDQWGSPSRFFKELTKLSYDHMGRVTTIKKKVGPSGTDQLIAENVYDELGQLKSKRIGDMETQNYEYNVRGWLLGANRGYIKGDSIRRFGYELAYEKNQSAISGSPYANTSFVGDIAGMMWKSAGDAQARRYDFSYDATHRLTGADFNQYTSSSFNKTAGIDFSVSGITYDYNGNFKTMQQQGLKGTSSLLIDNLSYTYAGTNSNRLAKVADAAANRCCGQPQLHPGGFCGWNQLRRRLCL